MLALEAKRAISQLPISELEYMRYQVAYNIKYLYKQYDKNKLYNTILDKKEKRILNHIKEKLISNNAIISKADKRKFYCHYLSKYISWESYGFHPQQQLH